MKRFTFPTNKHNLNQSSSYFKDNKRIPYTQINLSHRTPNHKIKKNIENINIENDK